MNLPRSGLSFALGVDEREDGVAMRGFTEGIAERCPTLTFPITDASLTFQITQRLPRDPGFQAEYPVKRA